jgi:hypothetical protein
MRILVRIVRSCGSWGMLNRGFQLHIPVDLRHGFWWVDGLLLRHCRSRQSYQQGKRGPDRFGFNPVNCEFGWARMGFHSETLVYLSAGSLLTPFCRVRQSIIRQAFRFYLGRNEMLSDSKTLIDADLAKVQSGGSFRAVIVA